jgi:hypothetical protein
VEEALKIKAEQQKAYLDDLTERCMKGGLFDLTLTECRDLHLANKLKLIPEYVKKDTRLNELARMILTSEPVKVS